MEQRLLGRTGMSVSHFCLGAMMFGAMGNEDHDDSVRVIHAAFDAGINFVDTAGSYSNGESEEILGKAIKGRREELIVATKFWGPMPGPQGETTNRQGTSRRWIMKAVEDSLRRLGTDYIDLYQQHRFDPDTAQEESLSALTDLVRQGKVRAIGGSAFPAERIVEAQWVSDRRGFERYRCEQARYSLFRRMIERAVLPTCGRYGMGVITYSPLDTGWLSGRFRSESDFKGESRFERGRKLFDPANPDAGANRRKVELLGQLTQVAEGAGLTLPQMATAWTVVHPDITSVIIGPRTMEQLQSSLVAADVTLADDVLDAIDAIVPPGSDVVQSDHPSAAPRELAVEYRRGRVFDRRR